MNGFQSHKEFHTLSREQLQQVAQFDPFYNAYVNILALLQDLIAEFADSLEKPYFTPPQIDEQKHKVLNSLRTSQMQLDPSKLIENIDENYRQAQKIRNRVESSETPEERFEAEQSATQFLEALTQTYTTLRILKQNRQPAQL